MDICVGAAGWYLVGYGVAYGDRGNEFIGTRYFGLQDVNEVRFSFSFQ
jgi:ammonia channel protein AmtB